MKPLSNSTMGDQETRSSKLIFLYSRNDDKAEALATQIRFFGYHVEKFSDIQGFEHAVRRNTPAVNVVDLDYLHHEAEDIFNTRVGKRFIFGEIPIIFLSSETSLENRLLAVRNGGSAFFEFPVDITALIDTLDQIAWYEPPSPMRVLIVDDSLVHANFNAMHLSNNGMMTEILTNPKNTLEVLDDFQPELILLDMYMPDCTGTELARVIRQIPSYIGVPIVFLSSETDRNRQLDAVSVGGDDFLVKPIKPEHLVSAVSSRIQRYRIIRELMLRDSLTGLYNHTTIKDHLRQEFARAQRSDYPLACVVLDLDHFKMINDTYGHAIGDRVLKSLSQLLVRRLRQSDIVGRYGGEEFVLVLPDTSVNTALKLVDELRLNFSKIRHRGDDVEFCLTFSGGIAGWPPYSSSNLLFEMADRALYAAKNRGRNQILIAE